MIDKETIEHVMQLIEHVKRDDGKTMSPASYCKLNVMKMNLRELLPEDDVELGCGTCRGSGIGQWGDPEKSVCDHCNGSGVEPKQSN